MSGISYTPAVVPLGGTGDGTLALYGVVLGQRNNPVSTVSGSSVGQVLTWTSSNPTFQTPTAGGLVLLTSGTTTAVATLDIVLTSYTAYRGIMIILSAFIPVTDATTLWMRFSTDGGVTYIASGYNYLSYGFKDTALGAVANSGSAAQIALTTAAVGNLSNEGINVEIKIFAQTSTAIWSRVTYNGYYINSDATPAGVSIVGGGGAQETVQDTDAIRFLFDSGNIASGNYAVYGYA